MKSQLKERWSELETEVKKLKAEASARGASANAEVAKIVADVEAKAKAARGKLESVAEAGSDEAGKSLTHLGEAYESAKKAVQDAWQALRK